MAKHRSACRLGVRDWIATAVQALFALWLLILLLAAPWQRGAAPALITLAITGGISLLVFRRAVDPLIQRFLFNYGSRRRCLDPFHRVIPRLPSITARRDPAWAAIARVPRMPLNEYYDSQPWRQRRELKLAEAGHRCQQCGGSTILQVHHLTYERTGRDRRSDLQVLCCACHGRIHHKNLCAFGRY